MKNAHWASVLFLAFAATASAMDTPALDITGLGSGFDYTQGTYSLGWVFTANKDLNITALGFYDDLKDGITGNHDVGIYDMTTQTLLVQTTVVPSDPLTGFFRYHALATPFVLTGGKTYVIEAVTLTDHYALSPNTVVDPAITFMGFAAYGSSGAPQSMTLQFPDGTNPSFVGDFGPSFLISNGGGGGPLAITALNVTDPGNNSVTGGIETGVQLSFNATATDTAALPVMFTWDFGDGSPLGSGAFVQHVYNIEGNFTTTLTASDGTNTATRTFTISAVAPNSGGAGIPNISQTYPAVMNPVNGLAVSIASSDGGVIQLNIDVSSLTRDTFNVSTEFDGLGGRSGVVPGLRPVMKFTTPGINVANVTATDPVSSALIGKGRKTLVIGSAEVGLPAAYTALPANQKAKKVNLSGKFSFAATGALSLAPFKQTTHNPDSVTFGGTIELPAGMDLSSNQTLAVGIGNIVDQVTVDAKGKAQLPSTATLIQKLQIKFPKLPKGQTKTVANQQATISLVLSGSNFSANGFDTEGISGTLAATDKAKKPASRSIQIALEIAGVPYQFSLPVQFKLGAGGATGSLGGRSAGTGL